MPGAKDEIVIWDSAGKKRRKRKYYLTMYLREAYVFFKETVADEECCSFSAFCKLRPKNVLLLVDAPKEQCKCQIHEKFFMKLEAMGCSYDNNFWGNVLCDVSENSNCWFSECESCRNGKKLEPAKPLNFETVYKKWEYVYIPSNKMEEGSEESEEPSQKFNKQLQIISKQVLAGNVLDDFTECFEEIVNHVNAKRIQAQAFQDDINDPSARVLQIDFAMAYQYEYQNEVQSALWTSALCSISPFDHKNFCYLYEL